ncbi:MAG: type II secretion system protein [Lachnospiraceae bacterium]|nr:type II secretion system protein [Lachnospiraceae bacterium]
MSSGKKDNNRGFTLIELVVVLVVLGILSALIMPGLLGYVDGVNEKSCLNNAKAAVTAAQSELSMLYQSGKKVLKGSERQKWAESMEFVEGSSLSVRCGNYTEENRRAAYTIVEAVYTESGMSVHFDGKEYKVVDACSPLALKMYGDGVYGDLTVVASNE